MTRMNQRNHRMKLIITIITPAILGVGWVSILIRESLLVVLISVLLVLIATLGLMMVLAQQRKLSERAGLLVLGGAGLLIAAAVMNLPLCWAFRLYESKFESLAAELKAGKKLSFPQRVGPFTIIGGQLRLGTGDPYLITGGEEGFVRNPTADGFNLWSMTQVSDTWSYVKED